MAAPVDTPSFLNVIRKSNQIDNTRLDSFLSERAQTETIPEPRKLAAQLVRAGVLTLFQAEQFLLGKHKGFNVAGYRILERLGVGGTGTVYLAEHQMMKRRVAVKVLPTPMASDPAIRERFRREAQVAGLLDHPNVVQVFDFRDENGLHAIVMEYVQGPNLQQLINKRGPQPIATACEFIRQTALGLQHAHDAGLVHRDIKPANLLLDSTGVIKVLDLGLARMEVAGEASLTRQFNNQMVMGTADFLPPEQAMNLHDVDSRADVYALGATFFSLLMGRPPFDSGSIGQKLLWHQTRVPDRVDTLRPDVPTELADLIAAMLAKLPDDRPSRCDEIAAYLEQWAGPPDSRVNIRPSPRTLAEFGLGRPSMALSCVGPSRMIPTVPAPDTLSSQAKEETGRISKKSPAVAPPIIAAAVPQTAPPPASAVSVRLIVLAVLGAAVAGLVGGLGAMLLMGSR